MDIQTLKNWIDDKISDVEIVEGKQFPEIQVNAASIHELARILKEKGFDFLVCLTSVDWVDYFTVVYHLESTREAQMIVVRAKIDNHDNPEIDTVSDIWPTAEFHEREVYDLMGIRFNHHPDLRRLFLEDDYGFPLRKDFKDEINMIER